MIKAKERNVTTGIKISKSLLEKKRPLEIPGKCDCLNHAKSLKKWQLKRNNKERLKNNILIKIEFWDVGGIIKWYGIMIKWFFGMEK